MADIKNTHDSVEGRRVRRNYSDFPKLSWSTETIDRTINQTAAANQKLQTDDVHPINKIVQIYLPKVLIQKFVETKNPSTPKNLRRKKSVGPHFEK